MYWVNVIMLEPITTEETEYTFTGLTPETRYFVTVTGVCGEVQTEASAIVEFITPAFTQTIELKAGYNWVSFYVEDEDGDPIALLDQLKANLGDNGLSIETNGLSTVYDGVEWFGDLDFEGIYNEQMYLIEVSDSCTIELQGTPVDPTLYEITIYPGYNWIGFPGSVEVSVADALADFEAEDEDQIEASNGVMYYWGEWVSDGDFETLVPGQGYFYFSNSEETKTLTFVVGDKKAKRANKARK